MDLRFEALHAHPVAGVPAPGIRVRGRGFVGYTSTTDRTGRIMPMAVIVAMPMTCARARMHRGCGTERTWLEQDVDIACKGTRCHGALSSAAVPHRTGISVSPETDMHIVHVTTDCIRPGNTTRHADAGNASRLSCTHGTAASPPRTRKTRTADRQPTLGASPLQARKTHRPMPAAAPTATSHLHRKRTGSAVAPRGGTPPAPAPCLRMPTPASAACFAADGSW